MNPNKIVDKIFHMNPNNIYDKIFLVNRKQDLQQDLPHLTQNIKLQCKKKNHTQKYTKNKQDLSIRSYHRIQTKNKMFNKTHKKHRSNQDLHRDPKKKSIEIELHDQWTRISSTRWKFSSTSTWFAKFDSINSAPQIPPQHTHKHKTQNTNY